MPTFNDFLGGLYKQGTDTEPQDSYRMKIKAMEDLIAQGSEESQAATQNAGAYSAMGKALDSMSANKMALGPGFKPTAIGTNANAEGILNAYQGAKAKGSEDKLKTLMDTYKQGTQAEGVLQEYGKNTTDALGKGANAIAAALQAAAASGTKTDKDVQNLMKTMEGTSGITYKVNELMNLTNDLKDENISGVGSPLYSLPFSDYFTPEKGVEVRQLAVGLMQDLIKIQSGTAVSDKEAERKLRQYGIKWDSPVSAFQSGIKSLIGEVQTELKRKEGGFKPAVVEKYKEQGGFGSKDFSPLAERAGVVPFQEGDKSGKQKDPLPTIDDIKAERERRKGGK